MIRSFNCTPADHRLSRRQWLGGIAGGAAAAVGVPILAQPVLADQLRKNGKQVLFVWLDGGICQLESWDPKPSTKFGGPFRAIPTTIPGLHISELLSKTSRQMHRLAVVRSMHTQDNSHSAGVARIQRGDPKNRGVAYPYFGSAVAKLLGSGESGLPPYVAIKPDSGGFIAQDAGFLGPQYGAIAFGNGQPPANLNRHQSLTAESDAERKMLRAAADARYRAGRLKQVGEANGYVFDMADRLQKRQDLFDAAKLPTKDRDRYGTWDLGRHMLIARQMLEAGVTFVKVTSFGWDSHGDNFNAHASLVPKFDRPFAAIIEDLHDRGMLDNVLVIAMSEFGRTPRINGHLGRDHWPEAWSLVMGGCGIRAGAVVGRTNATGTHVVTEEHDIGHMFHTWYKALGIDPTETEFDNAGQPLPIAHPDHHAVAELLA